ncbi:MAG: hypothetical protein ACREPE_05880 [Lysobacter sp.]
MTWLGALAALVALVTAVAMLKDTPWSAADRSALLAVLRRAANAFWCGGITAVDRAEFSVAVRFLLRIVVLILIVGSSGVCLLLGRPLDTYEALLRCQLAVFMAMQAPCPWWRYIVFGPRARGINERGDRHVH